MPQYLEKVAILQLLLFFTGPDFANAGACDGTATFQLVPEEGQVFYVQGASRNPGAHDSWLYGSTKKNWAMQTYRHTRSKVVESGKYKNIWHNCGNGYVVIEFISLGTNYYWASQNDDAIVSQRPCTDDRVYQHLKRDLDEGVICLEYYSNRKSSCKELHVMYIPTRCETFGRADSHCNCGSRTIEWQFSIEKGISNSQKSSSTVNEQTINEISSGIKLGAKVSATSEAGVPGVGSSSVTVEASVETSLGAKYSREVGTSWLSESSSTWSTKTTKRITIPIPSNTCMTLYQKTAHYGSYQVVGPKTINRERRPNNSEC